MKTFRRAGIPGILALSCGLLLIACEDPSGVGLTAIDFGETDPRAVVVEAETEVDTLVDATGFVLQTGVAFTNRFLAGRAEDPLFGTIEATGYIDFVQPGGLPAGFFTVEVEEAVLSLHPDYLYGDTTATATFDVYEIEEAWQPLQFRSDTALVVHDRLLASFSVAPSDTLVHVALPEDWVKENETLFRSQTFNADFHGFQIRPRPESGMAVGFRGTSQLLLLSQFQAQEGRDTTAFFGSGIATGTVTDRDAASPPADLVPIQDGAGYGLYLDVDLETLGTRAVSAGFIRIDADTLLLKQGTPGGFVRPIAETLTLYGSGAGPVTALANATLDPDDESYTFSSQQLTVVLQSMALGRSPFDRLVVGFPSAPSTLNVAPIIQREDAQPRAVLLVVPADL